MTKIGIFIPTGSRGWMWSTTTPATYPTYDLNRAIVKRAEHYGFDFALSMIKFRGFEGPSGFWTHNLESFTLTAALAAETSRIQLIASVAMLLLPPAYVASMVSTIDSIAPGRIGINMVTGWLPKEYEQMGVKLTPEHFGRRYERAAEYVTILKELWETGRSDFKGEYYQYDDCRLSPRPSEPVTIVGAGQSDKGLEFVAKYGHYNFVAPTGTNDTSSGQEVVNRVAAAAAKHGRQTSALQLLMVIADRTDELAWGKWEHYKQGVDLEADRWQAAQAGIDKSAAAGSHSTAGMMTRQMDTPLPNRMLQLIGSYENVARMLDEVAATPGSGGIMLCFDDFIAGIEQFGEHIQPLMRSRAHIRTNA